MKTRTGYQIKQQQTTANLQQEVAKRNKLNARKCFIDGHHFDSQGEARHYQFLKMRQAAGEIDRLELQPVYKLTVEGVHVGRFTPDFQYYDKAQKRTVVVDYKSPATAKKADFVLRKKLFEALYHLPLEVVS